MLIMLHYQLMITTKTSQLSSRWAKNNKHLHSIVQCDQNFLSFSTHVSWQLLFSCLIPNRWNFFFLMWSMPYTCGLGLFCLSLHFCRHPTCLFSDLKLWQCIFAYKMYFALFKTKLQKFSQLFKVGFLSSSSSKLYNFKFVK